MKYAEHEAKVIKEATKFVATWYTGRATYGNQEFSTLPDAVTGAEAILKARDPSDIANKGRPILIYAIAGVHQVVAKTIFPK